MATTPTRRDPPKQEVAKSPLAQFIDVLDRRAPQFQQVMPEETWKRFQHAVVTTLSENQDLLRCTPTSLLSVCRHAAQDGLMLDKKEAAIVPFRVGGEVIATYQPMVQGLRKKVMASGLIKTMDCQIVFEGDKIDVRLGSHPNVDHKPALSGSAKRLIIGAYSDVEFTNGGRSVEYMSLEQINEIKLKSPAVKSGRDTPWKDEIFFPEMCRKTVFRRHSKMLPMASDIENIFRNQEHQFAEVMPEQPPPQIEQTAAPSTSVIDTLDQFGSGFLPPSDDKSTKVSGEEAEGGQAVSGAVSETIARAPAATDAEVDAIKKAYRRGQDDRKAGKQQDAMPEEFQDNAHNKQQIAWMCGFDGKAIPTFGGNVDLDLDNPE